MKNIHPITILLVGVLFVSLGINISLWRSNINFVSKIEELEHKSQQVLFIQPIDPKSNSEKNEIEQDQYIDDLIKKILKKMLNERIS